MTKLTTAHAKQYVLSALDKYYDFVSPTYGPAGRQVLIDNGVMVRAIDDGKIASQEFEIENEIENAVIKYIRQASAETDDRVGDGTTTAAVLTVDMVRQILTVKDFQKQKDILSEVLAVKKALPEAVKQIRKGSKQVDSKEQLYAIAYNSFNDEGVAKLISDTLFEIGKDGFISIEDSRGVSTEKEIVSGLQIEKGLLSPYFISNEKGQAIINAPQIIVINSRVSSFQELIPVITTLMENGNKEFVIVADSFEQDVIQNIIVNRMKGVFNALLIESPGYGSQKVNYLIDIASVVGATLIDPQKGDSLESITLDKAGFVEVVRVDKNTSTFINGKGRVTGRVKELKTELEQAQNAFEREGLTRRIAQLEGGIAVIRVGALTEGEQKTRRAKIEDAVNASKSAFKGGLSEGAGKTFEKIKTSSETLNTALKSPRKLLEENGKDWLDEDTLDPTEVLVASLETAVSTACGLVSLSGIVAPKQEKKENNF